MTHCKTLHSIICRVKGTPCHLQAVLQGLRTTLKQLPRGPEGAGGFLLVLSSTPLALRGRSWAMGMLNLRKPQGRCKGARYGSLPSGVLWSSNDEGRLPPTGQVQGSHRLVSARETPQGKGGFVELLQSRPTLCSQTKNSQLVPNEYFPV